MDQEVYYGDYLQLDKILNAQQPLSARAGAEAHDEMLFIIVHQAYELWFRQIRHEMTSIIRILSQPRVDDNSPDIFTVVHRLKRIAAIWQLAVHQVDVIETMTPLDFLDFRDRLRPASGFQSYQFKILEAMMGLKFADRHGKEFYLKHLRPEHIALIEQEETRPSLIELVNQWLERMPFFDLEYWQGKSTESRATIEKHPFWQAYLAAYRDTLNETDRHSLQAFYRVLITGEDAGRLSAAANRAALFIMLYRDFPLLQIPFQLLDTLIEIDELMTTWRTRHIAMVRRMIGARSGTGGSSGANYLRESSDRHVIFSELATLSSFLIQRARLPELPAILQQKLGFNV